VEINKIYNEDCIETISKMPNNFIDLVVTSPPYNVDLGNNKYNKHPYNLYNDNKSHKEYIKWLSNIFMLLYPKLKVGGRVCINIGDGKNGAIPTSCDINNFMSGEIGYIPTTHIIWDKSQVGNRTSWGSWMSPSCPSFPTPFEHILVFAKDSNKLQWKGQSDLTKDEFIEWSLALWKFQPQMNQKQIGHPAMFPIELPLRCIKMFSWINSVIYDPFGGSGSTAIACVTSNRKYICSEISTDYCDIANKRLDDTKNAK